MLMRLNSGPYEAWKMPLITQLLNTRMRRDRTRRLIVGYGVSMPYDDLEDGAYNVKATPKTWGVNAIHFGPAETANGITRIRTPIDQIVEASNDWECTFHNRNETYQLGNPGLGW